MVTGAARGQGRSHALAFARAGASLVISDVDGLSLESVPYGLSTRAELDGVAEEIAALGAECLPITCDVRDSGQVQEMVRGAEERFGKIDVLVNNAGIESIYSTLEMPDEAWDEMLAVNLRGPFLCSKYVAAGMAARGRGKIINTASAAVERSSPAQIHYNASKHGLVGMSKAMAVDLAPHRINVNLVCPGPVDSPMVAGVYAAHKDWFDQLASEAGPTNLFDKGGMLAPEEITQAVLWLASEAADSVTGSAVFVDAGCAVL